MYGWERQGSKLLYRYGPDGEIVHEDDPDWGGGYGSNDFQEVTPDDAAQLAGALERALRDIPDGDNKAAEEAEQRVARAIDHLPPPEDAPRNVTRQPDGGIVVELTQSELQLLHLMVRPPVNFLELSPKSCSRSGLTGARQFAYTEGGMTGSELRRIRTRAKVSQAQLSRLIEVDVMTVSRWERGVSKISGPVAQLLRWVLARKPAKRGRQ